MNGLNNPGVVSTPVVGLSPEQVRTVPMPHYCKDVWEFLHSAEEYSDGINMTRLVTTFRGKFDRRAWNRSLERLMQRHPVLAARVTATSEGLEFVVNSQRRPQLRIVDISACSNEDLAMTLRTLVTALVWESFDAQEGRLFRTFAISVSDSECVLGVVAHHFIADGWSMEIIGRELLITYAAEISGRRLPLPERYVEYLDHIQWMARWLQGPEAQSQAAYWAQQLADPPDVRLPTLDNVDLDALAQWAYEKLTLEPALVRAVCAYAGKIQTTPFVTILTAFIAALSAIVQSSDIVVMIVAEQRSNPRLRYTVGYLVNLLPLRVAVKSDESFHGLATKVGRAYSSACSNQLHPYLLDEWRRNTFPSVRFRRLAPMECERASGSAGFSPFELPERPERDSARRSGAGYWLDIEHRGHSMCCRAGYLPTLYTQKTAARLVRIFRAAVEMAAEVPDSPVSALKFE